jgi:hypothetical protein
MATTFFFTRSPAMPWPGLTSARHLPGQQRWRSGPVHAPRWPDEIEFSPRPRRLASG